VISITSVHCENLPYSWCFCPGVVVLWRNLNLVTSAWVQRHKSTRIHINLRKKQWEYVGFLCLPVIKTADLTEHAGIFSALLAFLFLNKKNCKITYISKCKDQILLEISLDEAQSVLVHIQNCPSILKSRKWNLLQNLITIPCLLLSYRSTRKKSNWNVILNVENYQLSFILNCRWDNDFGK
jgi:hypothetical protein